MDKFRNYEVSFSGLKNGKHEFYFEIDKEFFQLFDTEQDFTNPEITAKVLMNKHSTFLEFNIRTCGEVELVCDITNEAFCYSIENEVSVLVKFGKEYDDSDEDIIIIPMNDHSFNVSQLIYESIVLSIPMKKISPNVSDKDLEILNKFSSRANEEKESQNDPRWNTLKKLKK